MILKLDPRWPIVWRSPSSLQLGIDPPLVVLDGVTEAQERLVAALAVGVSDGGLGLVTRSSAEERFTLLELLAPALVAAPRPPIPRVVAVSGSGATVEALAGLLASSGVHTLVSERAETLADQGADVAVAIGHFVLPPALHSLWLRRDVPHLPIVFGDSAVVVGPLVEPGDGPCLRCLELVHRDADPAWPAVASQVLGRRGVAESAVLTAEAAAVAARVVLDRLVGQTFDPSVSTRIDGASGVRTTRNWQRHPECGCRGLGHLVATESGPTARRRETGWAAAVPLAQAPGLPTN
ncbi:MAG: hypothetical protein ABL886_02870 [Rhodoglobus sp.]